MSSERLVVRGLSADWDGVPVLRDIDLDVRAGELVALLGPNGSGKTTLLRCLAGLETPRAGTITLAGRSLDRLPTHRRGLGMVAQEPSLFPHRTVLENVAYGLAVRKVPAAPLRTRVEELLRRLDLERFAGRYPREISGGEQQRVALARALAPNPALVLLDEPFAAVDPEYRAELRSEFRRVLLGESTAAIHVTHDREEGLYLGDRVVVLLDGRIAQVGRPAELIDRPASARVARFLGYSILVEGGRARAVAPEDVELVPPAGGFPARVVASGLVGRERSVEVELEDRTRLVARRPREELLPDVGEPVGVRIRRSIELPTPDGTP